MAKAINKKKAAKKRESTYDPKLAIKGTFEDVIALSVTAVPVKKNQLKSSK